MGRHSRPKRRTSLVLALATGLSTLLAVPASAAKAKPSDLVEACTDAPSAEDRFNDYGSRSARQRWVIDCLAAGYKGNANSSDFVLQGNGRIVSFDATISRAQFAVILNRVADYLGVPSRSAPSQPSFADVPVNHVFHGEIEELYARGLTNGAGPDSDDVDGDGNTSEPTFNPSGTVSYAQVLGFLHRLLTDPSAAGMTLPNGQPTGQTGNLDCGFFEDQRKDLDDAGFLLFANTPSDCRSASPRGLVFDLIAVSFDQAVEVAKISSAHRPTPTTGLVIDLALDRSSAFANEAVTATATVKDANGVTVQGRAVEVFAVRSSDGFDASGDPKADGNLNVGGTNRWGTGTTPGKLDASDPVTDSSGKATTTVMGLGSGGTFDVYAFVGSAGAVWKDVRGTSQASPKRQVEFKASPSGIVVSSQASERNTLPHGTSHVVRFQMVDANKNPVKVAGAKVVAELFRTDTCSGPPQQSAPCNGQTRRFAVQSLVTDANGLAQWTVTGAPDPRPNTNCDANGNNCQDSGDKTVDRFHGTWDQNGDGLPNDGIATSPDLEMTFLDVPAGRVEVATVRFIASNNPNKLDETGSRTATAVDFEVSVTDVYGNPANGVLVQFQRSVAQTETTVTTGSNGKATFTSVGPNTPGDYAYTVRVDGDRDGIEVTDLQATTPTGGNTMTIHWVGSPPPVATYSNQRIVGFSTAGTYVDIHDVRLPYDDGDEFFVGGESVSRGQFESAILADAGSNDTLTVSPYQAGGISTFRLTVNGSSPVLP